jgi:hypothetical protein
VDIEEDIVAGMDTEAGKVVDSGEGIVEDMVVEPEAGIELGMGVVSGEDKVADIGIVPEVGIGVGKVVLVVP